MICNTLTGKKLIIGLLEQNYYLQVNRKYIEIFLGVMNKLNQYDEKNKNFSDAEMKIIEMFRQKGFLEGQDSTKKSFNEFNSFVKVIYEKEMKALQNQRQRYREIFFVIYSILWIGCIAVFLQNINYLDYTIYLKNFTLLEVVICLTAVPLLVNATHELGHYLIAVLLGVSPKSLTIGFFVTWPTVYIKYRGLNLYSTSVKICVMSGGIFAHIFNVFIGLILKKIGIESSILEIWIAVNVSMVITNLLLFGPTDGYFMVSNLIGIFNLRLKGYRGMSKMIHMAWHKLSREESVCGLVLLVLWLMSFVGVYKSFQYYLRLFSIHGKWTWVVIYGFIGGIFIRFLYKLFRLKWK